MRRLLILAALLATVACQRAPQVASAPATWSDDERQIRAMLEESTAGWNAASLTRHLSLYDSSVTFMTRNGPRPGVEAIRQSFNTTYFVDGKPKQALSFSSVAVRPLGRDAALSTGRFLLSGGGEPDRSGWFTLVWVRTANGWRAVHDHSS